MRLKRFLIDWDLDEPIIIWNFSRRGLPVYVSLHRSTCFSLSNLVQSFLGVHNIDDKVGGGELDRYVAEHEGRSRRCRTSSAYPTWPSSPIVDRAWNQWGQRSSVEALPIIGLQSIGVEKKNRNLTWLHCIIEDYKAHELEKTSEFNMIAGIIIWMKHRKNIGKVFQSYANECKKRLEWMLKFLGD
jgi:hypothetical protein